MLEAALIDLYRGYPGCKNIRNGGDTVKPSLTSGNEAFSTYVVYRSFKYPPPIPPLRRKAVDLASCAAAISTAREIVADIGEAAASRSGGLLEIARCHETHTERDTHRVLVKKLRLALDIKRSRLATTGPDVSIPLLRLRDWFAFLLKHNCSHMLAGLVRPDSRRESAILCRFWALYKTWDPEHEIFAKEARGEVSFSSCVPLCFHGDEGRSRKHSPFMILSFYSMLGRGLCVEKRQRRNATLKRYLKLKPNFKGHSYSSRFMFAALRKRDYTGANEHVWESVLEAAAEESSFLCNTGVQDASGKTYSGVLLAIVGDWPFLHKSGSFKRSFNNIQKRINQRSEPVGICHLCRAGQRDVEFEQIATRRPKWVETLHEEDPFEIPSPFINVAHSPGKLAALWCYDVFHTWHLGVAKNFLGSVLALMSEQFPQGNIEQRFEALTDMYRAWCNRTKRRCHVFKITKELLQWTSLREFPTGSWHKGALSTVLMEFVEWRFQHERFANEPLLAQAAEACFAIQNAIRGMYMGDLWLSPAESLHVAENGFRFLRRYAALAAQAARQGRSHFVLQPKIHIIPHWMVALHKAGTNGKAALNPIGMSCQQNEDFIGRGSRLSRKVTARGPVLDRVLDRYLQAAYSKWVACGYLVRPG
ncbi:Uncharacterized protein SCF082_LOCUS30127 [Durusdinium trenchii]